MKIAIPLANGKLTAHFGHCQEFAFIEVEESKIKKTETHVPPPHEPGVLPGWLHDMQTDVIIAGGMGQRALSLFEQKGIAVITGAPALEPETLVENYLDNTLATGENVCDH
jgi:predicted Fe-Mo cluster-binding NifX family protein